MGQSYIRMAQDNSMPFTACRPTRHTYSPGNTLVSAEDVSTQYKNAQRDQAHHCVATSRPEYTGVRHPHSATYVVHYRMF